MKFYRLSFVLILLLQCMSASTSNAAYDSADEKTEGKLYVRSISPSGKSVSNINQIVINFNRKVMPLSAIPENYQPPVQITPTAECDWQWLSATSLACQLSDKNKLNLSTKYEIKVLKNFEAEDGTKISDEYTHSFTTLLPRIKYQNFHEWQSPTMPVIRVVFNQNVTKESVEKHMFMAVSGNKIRRNIKAFPESSNNHNKDTKHSRKNKNNPNNVWLVSPVQDLPADSEITLKVEPGLKSPNGAELGDTYKTVISFDTFPEFKFTGVYCSNGEEAIHLKADEIIQKPETFSKCAPLKGVSLGFSSPVSREEIKTNLVLTPDLAGGRKDYDPWANTYDSNHLQYPHSKGKVYKIYLPERLRADKKYNLKTKKKELSKFQKLKQFLGLKNTPKSEFQDVFGRHLEGELNFDFYTDNRMPNMVRPHQTSVLEKGVTSDHLIYTTNLEQIIFNYKSLTPDTRMSGQIHTLNLPQDVKNIQFASFLGIKDILNGSSGVVSGRIRTNPHIHFSDYESKVFSQVTPYQVHAKLGHFNSVVWVSELAGGEPVSGAKVSIYKDKSYNLSNDVEAMDIAETNADGIAIMKGREQIDPKNDIRTWACSTCDNMFIKVEKDGDMALLPLTSQFSINEYYASGRKFWALSRQKYAHMKAWGTTAQGVYTAGENIKFKLYVRGQDNDTFVKPDLEKYTLTINDPTGKEVYKKEGIKLSEFGGFADEYKTPKNAISGWYNFNLKPEYTNTVSWTPMTVLVTDFTPSPFNVSNEVNGKLFKAGDTVEVNTYARLHSGGAYTDAGTRVTATLNTVPFSSPHPLAAGFRFDTDSKTTSKVIFNISDKLNDKGEFTTSFKPYEKDIVYGNIVIESAVRDDRGKNIAGTSSAKYVAFDRFVGLKSTKWIYKEDEPALFKYIVVDEKGNPAKGSEVNIKIERKVTKSSKVKSAGNAYLTQYVTEWKEAGTCKGISVDDAMDCEFTPTDPGTYRMKASIPVKFGNNNDDDNADNEKTEHSTSMHFWVAGKGRVVWEEPKDNSLQILAEKPSYNIGDTAKYFIKNPYPGAKAMITVERYGILKQWVQTFDSSTALVEFPVEKNFMPGFYLSVTVFSPRVDKPLPGIGKVDMGKPTFKTGYVKVPVKDPYKQIDVKITTDAETYEPRDTAKITLTANVKNKDMVEPIEVAVVVIDEAVLDLIKGGTGYYNAYDNFYKLDNLDMQNYSLLTRLIGRQQIRKKGANSGGGGGSGLHSQKAMLSKAASMEMLAEDGMGMEEVEAIQVRDLFKYVSYWNPSIKLDASGKTSFDVELPDNLTGWRVLAIAVTPTDRFGLGQGKFKVNRKTEIRPVMPNQITEGDEFKAGFSVMNRTDKPRTINVEIEVQGKSLKTTKQKGKNDAVAQSFNDKMTTSIELAPYKRKTVFMPVKTKGGGGTSLKFTAKAYDAVGTDGTSHYIRVQKRRALETVAFYGTTTKPEVTEQVKVDANIFPDVGSISVALSPSVIGNAEGAFKYMRDYKYPCWEQKLTKAVMAMHYQNLKAYMPDDFEWKGSDKITQRLINLAANYQAPNGGMVYFTANDKYVSPYLSAYTAMAFNWLRESGYTVPTRVEKKLHAYLKNILRNNDMPSFYSKGMSSTVRAVSLAALSEHGKISPSDINRYEPHVDDMSLFGKAWYMHAAVNTLGDRGTKIIDETADKILSHANQTGGKYMFTESIDNGYARILATPLRTNCAILSVLTKYGETDKGAQIVKDIPYKLVRTITQTRGNRDHWENTQENIFCMNALVDYARIYESDKPNMKVKVSMDDRKMGSTAFKSLKDDVVEFSHPISEQDLGTKKTVTINKDGSGRIYYKTQMKYALKNDREKLLNAGIDVRKEYSVKREGKWQLMKSPLSIRRGELVKVDIFVSVPAARNFVVVDDPVPGGLEPVNRDLATASGFDADSAAFDEQGGSWWFRFSDWSSYGIYGWSFYHKELNHDAVRFYADYLPAGNYHLSYAAQAIAEGEFSSMPVYAEEMYDADIFGKGITRVLKVAE
jgi:uncharacterized protein YfaS (alpha-2-macroglobulin family)